MRLRDSLLLRLCRGYLELFLDIAKVILLFFSAIFASYIFHFKRNLFYILLKSLTSSLKGPLQILKPIIPLLKAVVARGSKLSEVHDFNFDAVTTTFGLTVLASFLST